MAADVSDFRVSPRRKPFTPGQIALQIFLILGCFIMIMPFIWMLSTSLKRPAEVFTYPPTWIPSEIAWDNYPTLLRSLPFGRFYINSTIVTVCVTVLQLFASSLAAFAFARLQFPGRNILFVLYLATLMIPFQVTMIPNFIIVRLLGWYDTYQALILPPSFSAFSTFLLRQYFMSIPRDLDEAARMDGASSLRIWWSVLLPLVGPAIAALCVFTALNTWNEFLWPLVVTNSQEMWTLQVGLNSLQGQYNVRWELLMAGSVVGMLPMIIIYAFTQRWFIRGITMTGMGGR